MKFSSGVGGKEKLEEISIPYREKRCQAKVTHFLKSDENFVRQCFAQQDNYNLCK